MTKLMQFVSPVYEQYYQDVIRNHKKIVSKYTKIVGRRKIRKIEKQSQSQSWNQTGKQKNYFNLVYLPTKIYFGQKSVPLVVIMFRNSNFARIFEFFSIYCG